MLKIKPIITLTLFFIILIISVTPLAGLQAQNIQDDQVYTTRYFSPEEIKRADKIVLFLSSPEVVYSVLVAFSLLVVFATYFIIVALIVVLFFSSFL